MLVDAILPALDEEQAIVQVLKSLPSSIRQAYVVDNGSRDRTAEWARSCGAVVVFEPVRGYGSACLRGIRELAQNPPEVVVFLDADGADDPTQVDRLLARIAAGADLVIGSRTLGTREKGSMTWPARVGNWLAPFLIGLVWRVRFTDLGPFRAIRWQKLVDLGMTDRGYGWTVEMQIRAVRLGLVCAEVPVSYRPRIGTSKISGTIKGCLGAGTVILSTWFRHARDHYLGRPLRTPA